MTCRLTLISTVIFLLSGLSSKSQELVTFSEETHIIQDSLVFLNKKPIIPGSVIVHDNKSNIIHKKDYEIKGMQGVIRFHKLPVEKEIKVLYRFFSIDISNYKRIQKKRDTSSINREKEEIRKKYYNPEDLKQNSNNDRKLKLNGSIARGVNIGNNQSSSLNSNLNLQIEGNLSEKLQLKASITDKNIPVQPEGNRENLQEFDKVFIDIYNKDFSLRAGDITLNQNKDKFLVYNKNGRGATINADLNIDEKTTLKTGIGAAVSKGKYNKMNFTGQEGNQGPYRLKGANNEKHIVIISGTEKIYLDGELLTRGETKDYVIDYNTGELTFTANNIITKDSRIIAEFQYKTSNYNRFMVNSNNKISKGNNEWFIRYFNEFDAKNQPLNKSIDSEIKNYLSNIGDRRQELLYPSWDSTEFDNDRIRYKLTDTTVNNHKYDSVFVYSTNSDSAHYEVEFSYTGENKGNYIKEINSANGRIYKWVAPVNGTPSGNYSPITKLVTPVAHQGVSIGGKNTSLKNTKINYQINFTDKDINTYSDKDSGNDQGFALNTGIVSRLIKSENNRLETEINYNLINKNFTTPERFREQEFQRDWDITNDLPEVNEHSGDIALNYSNKKDINASISSSLIHRPEKYTGTKQQIQSIYNNSDWKVSLKGDLLNSKQKNYKSFFLKTKALAGRKFEKLELYSSYNREWQEGKIQDKDSLAGNSFDFYEIESWINQGKKSENKWKLSYKYRLDKLPFENTMLKSTESHKIDLRLRILNNENNRFFSKFQLRNLNIINSTGKDIKPQNNIVSQFNYSHNSLKGFISGRVFYRSGAGLELKKEYTYLKVADGQGSYTWTDYNNNGKEELNEFETAIYQDQADYIRIYTPVNEYVKTYNNNLNFNFNLKPSKLIKKKNGLASFISKFSNRMNFNVSNKNTANDLRSQYIPVSNLIPDTSLVFINNNFRNIFSWNRMSNVFTSDLVYEKQNSRNLLINGLETNNKEAGKLRFRLNAGKTISISNNLSRGINSYNSEFFPEKNFKIYYTENKLDFRYQPGINMRFKISANFSHKEDRISDNFSRSINPGIKYSNNNIANGMLRAKIEYIYVEYSGKKGTSLSWHMLESLEPGNNYRWTVSFSKRLSNGLQVNLNYQGRKPDGVKTIHTGGIQLRAYF